MTGKIKILQQSDVVEARCPFCHEDVGVGRTTECPECSVTLHEVCADEIESCPTLGCRRRFDEPKEETPRASRRSDNQTAMLAHLSTFAGWLIPIPFFNVIAPFVVWRLFRGQHRPETSVHAARATNFQATMALAGLACIPLCWFLIGFLLLPLIWLFDVWHTFRAMSAASRGRPYMYPYSIEFIDETAEAERWDAQL